MNRRFANYETLPFWEGLDSELPGRKYCPQFLHRRHRHRHYSSEKFIRKIHGIKSISKTKKKNSLEQLIHQMDWFNLVIVPENLKATVTFPVPGEYL